MEHTSDVQSLDTHENTDFMPTSLLRLVPHVSTYLYKGE